MLTSLLFFFIIAAVIFFAGKQLSHYGDLLADYTGLGKAWIGLILMSAVTSLPELMVGMSSSALLQSADLAVGDVLGSCAFNLGILSVLDFFTPKKEPLFNRISQGHIIAAAFGVILLSLTGAGLFLNHDIVLIPSLGITSISFAVIYFISVKTIFNYQVVMNKSNGNRSDTVYTLSKKQVILRYILFASVIVIAATALPYLAEEIAVKAQLNQSFVGTLFLAVSTSLPEIAISIAAIRTGSVDMAVGNLLGSNIFNIFLLFIDDLFYTRGHLLKDASEINLISVFAVIIMSATAIIGLIFPGRKKTGIIAWDTFIIFITYLLNIILLYKLSTS